MYDLIILGAGTAGLTSSIYATRGGASTMIIEKNFHGGQIVNSPQIDNYPSLANVSGFDFAQNLYTQAMNLGANITYETVIEIDITSTIKTIKTNQKIYKTKSVIIATGATHRKLNCENEDKLDGKGISYCATCDGAFYKQKDVAVVGGGNTALDESLFLSKIAKKVFLIHRRDFFRGNKLTLNKIRDTNNIEIITDSIIQKAIGSDSLNSIEIKNLKTENISNLDISGLFVSVGITPESDMFKDILNIDEYGYIISGEDCKTNLKGVFVAGDVRTKALRQLVTATSDGAIAATNCLEFLLD